MARDKTMGLIWLQKFYSANNAVKVFSLVSVHIIVTVSKRKNGFYSVKVTMTYTFCPVVE